MEGAKRRPGVAIAVPGPTVRVKNTPPAQPACAPSCIQIKALAPLSESSGTRRICCIEWGCAVAAVLWEGLAFPCANPHSSVGGLHPPICPSPGTPKSRAGTPHCLTDSGSTEQCGVKMSGCTVTSKAGPGMWQAPGDGRPRWMRFTPHGDGPGGRLILSRACRSPSTCVAGAWRWTRGSRAPPPRDPSRQRLRRLRLCCG